MSKSLIDSELGKELSEFHLLKASKLNAPNAILRGDGDNKVEKNKYNDENKTVHLNKNQFFDNIESDVWNFSIGSYQILYEWLKARKSRILTSEEILQYRKIIVAIRETIRLMEAIDTLIDQRGGWPKAFK